MKKKPRENTEATLFIHQQRTPDDMQALLVTKGRFRRVHIAERREGGETLPMIFVGNIRLKGLEAIEKYVSRIGTVVKAR